jgi:uncharacterized membrane protein YdjX (TVP38/TMEM64 family)
MERTAKKTRKVANEPRKVANELLALAAFPLVIGAIVAAVIIWRDPLWRLFTSPQLLRAWVSGWGIWAPLVFIALQALQVVVFVIPGEVPQIAGGYLFGAWLGSLLSIAGILIGSAASFFLARGLGRPFVAALFPVSQVEKIEKLLTSRSARIVFFLLFLIPGIPKDVLCYVAGLTPMGFPFFAAASTLGRLPGIVGSAVIGSAAASSKWVLAAIVGAAATALFGAGLILRPRIQSWMERISKRDDSDRTV